MRQQKNVPCLTKIRALYPSLSEKEKKVADYILNEPRKIIHETISEVADHLQLAEATVFRFCQSVGFRGFQALKIALASELVSPLEHIHETIAEDDDEETIVEKVFQSNIQTLKDTLHVIDDQSFAEAVEAIANANKIDFYGNGGSGIVALDAHHKFLRTGLVTAAYQDSHLQMMSCAQLNERDVAVFISHSGSNSDILQTLDVAKKRGVTTIGITSYAKSPLGECVDIPLYTISKETEYRPEAFSSRIAQLAIIDALYVNVSIARKDTMQQSLMRMREAISLKRM